MEVEKTPVSILNELMTKLGIVPIYEVTATSNNVFGIKTFDVEVTCDKVTASGSGKSKKEAKHCAAKAMLAKVNKDKVVDENVKESVSPALSLEINYVMELKVCERNFKL